MIEEERYCIDILAQMKAIRSSLKSLESKILEEHLKNCVKKALSTSSKKASENAIEEILTVLKRSMS